MVAKRGRFRVGTSGWSYSWEGFYPADLPSRKYLEHYSRTFDTVEVNYSFYHLPRAATFEKWAAQTPEDFLFALKLSRFITHVRRLSDPSEPLERFLSNALALGRKLGPILVQMPPSFGADTGSLERFMDALDAVRSALSFRFAVAFEFRHESWFQGDTLDDLSKLLSGREAAIVFAHSSRYPYPQTEPLPCSFAYLRFHGPGKLFASRYGKNRLAPWTKKVKKWLREGIDVFAYFNNDVNGYAFMDAGTLAEMVGKRSGHRAA